MDTVCFQGTLSRVMVHYMLGNCSLKRPFSTSKPSALFKQCLSHIVVLYFVTFYIMTDSHTCSTVHITGVNFVISIHVNTDCPFCSIKWVLWLFDGSDLTAKWIPATPFETFGIITQLTNQPFMSIVRGRKCWCLNIFSFEDVTQLP